MKAEDAKRTLLAIEIPRDELALQMLLGGIRNGQGLKDAKPPAGMTAAQALADADRHNPGLRATLLAQADAAVAYIFERIQAGRQPS
jgi:hypothetical protein